MHVVAHLPITLMVSLLLRLPRIPIQATPCLLHPIKILVPVVESASTRKYPRVSEQVLSFQRNPVKRAVQVPLSPQFRNPHTITLSRGSPSRLPEGSQDRSIRKLALADSDFVKVLLLEFRGTLWFSPIHDRAIKPLTIDA